MFQAKATAEFARLRRCQAELEVETGQLAFVGLSVVDSLRQVGLGGPGQGAGVQTCRWPRGALACGALRRVARLL